MSLFEPLLAWYGANARALPWRATAEPYAVLVSETMLQQTRAAVVTAYFPRFLAAFPTPAALAAATKDELHALWQGLGYYRRAANLQRAAQTVAAAGAFPSAHDGILRLPGVGAYTAGAVASICFNLPTPAVDGNVLRVAARLRADGRDVRLPAVAADVRAWLTPYYEATENRGMLTQALMELGACVCVPGLPKCGACPLAAACRAGAEGTQNALPVRGKAKARTAERLTVFVLAAGDEVAFTKRGEAGLLAGLWQLPNVPGHLSDAEAVAWVEALGVRPLLLYMKNTVHIFTHREWHMRVFGFRLDGPVPPFTWAAAPARPPLPSAFAKLLP
ncbi:MAG: NUDIX domain-containing protein [Clostridiales bacterium]|jgi:A/G-specific adenine glycosylase|nr:NUDIX domain-containing protein [Clostridiales bacterium]